MKPINRFEILGVFGSGKTTLAKLVAENINYFPKLEDHLLNPYWGQQALLESGGNLAYDLSFLIQHLHLVQSSMHSTESCIICDWSFETDDLWASLRLDPDELTSYRTTRSLLLRSVPSATGYIYLDIDPEEIYRRMQKRGRKPEISINKEKIVYAYDILKDKVKNIRAGNILTVDKYSTLTEISDFINRGTINER